MKNVLVTGAAGFLGQNLVKKLDIIGLNVVCVDKNPKTNHSLKMDCASREFTEYFNHQKPFDVIFHLGSPCSIIQFNEDLTYCVRSTLDGFRRVLELTKKWNAQLIYPSSGNVYGNCLFPHTERKFPLPTNMYGTYKYLCEQFTLDTTFNTVGLRIYAGYGPLEEQKGVLASVIYQFLSKMLKDQSPIIWGMGGQTRDFIFIDDIVDAFIKSMSLHGRYIINVGSGKSYSFLEVIKIINKILNKDLDPKYISKPKNYVDQTLSDTKYLKKILGVNPKSLEDGIQLFVDYLLSL